MIGEVHSTTIGFADCVVTTTSVIFLDHQGTPNPGGRITPDGLVVLGRIPKLPVPILERVSGAATERGKLGSTHLEIRDSVP